MYRGWSRVGVKKGNRDTVPTFTVLRSSLLKGFRFGLFAAIYIAGGHTQ